ncbi:hypothetical protein A2U01_0052713, partial [Trifolium medium]|nr:hypothetical protein [Trifolium medium]
NINHSDVGRYRSPDFCGHWAGMHGSGPPHKCVEFDA